MNQIKSVACLVALIFIGGATLSASDSNEFRQWTDAASGRTITARLVERVGSDQIKIEREDGITFVASLTAFSAEDQTYVRSRTAATPVAPKAKPVTLPAGLKAADSSLWAILSASGAQPETTYSGTSLDLVLETINRRFEVDAVKSQSGHPLRVRTEPVSLAGRITLSGAMPRMSLSTFMKEIARANNLLVATDAKGLIVLVDQSPGSDLEFLGVKVNER